MKKLLLFLVVCSGVSTFSCISPVPDGLEKDAAFQTQKEESEWVQLSAPSSWQIDRGSWIIVGAVSLDPEDETRFAVKKGEPIWVNGLDGKTVDLHSSFQHGDAELRFEFMVPKGSNSGVYLQSRYEIQIFDSWGIKETKYSDCGGIYQRWKDNHGFEGHPPRVNVSRPPGEWQSFDVIFRAPRFDSAGKKIANAQFVKVLHNGTIIHENVEVTGPTRAATFEDEAAVGPLMIQGDHGPVAFRNVRIRRVQLD
jgi:hypothetical protein